MDLLGWKAIPFAREDLDSNYSQKDIYISELNWARGQGRRNCGLRGTSSESEI